MLGKAESSWKSARSTREWQPAATSRCLARLLIFPCPNQPDHRRLHGSGALYPPDNAFLGVSFEDFFANPRVIKIGPHLPEIFEPLLFVSAIYPLDDKLQNRTHGVGIVGIKATQRW